MTNFLPPRLTPEQHAKAVSDKMESMPGITNRPGSHPYISSGKEMEAFSRTSALYAANNIPVRPEPRSQAEFEARFARLAEDAAKVGLIARWIHPQDVPFLGGPVGLGHSLGGIPDTAGKLSAMEHYVARELAAKAGFDAYKAEVEAKNQKYLADLADHRRRQARSDPEYVESLERRLAALESANAATKDAPAVPELPELPDPPEAYGLEPASRGFLNKFRRQ